MGSLIAMALKWTGLSQGVMELIAIGTLLGGVGGIAAYEHHKIFKEGVAAQHAADLKQAAATAAALDAQRKLAEQNYAKSQKALADYIAANPLQPIRLCLNKITLPAAANTKGVSGVAAAPILQQVPAGNSGSGAGAVGPDISGMLSALADRADEITDAYRSQTR